MTTYPAPGTRFWKDQLDAVMAAEEAEVTAMENAEQPDGIDNDSLDLPAPERAATRVREFLSEFGDGLIPVGCVDAPLYARDLEALSNLARAAGDSQ